MAGHAKGKSLNRVVSERLMGQIKSSWIPESFTVSPDGKRMACRARVGNKRLVVVDGKEEKQYDSIGTGPPIFSLDSQRVAYVAGGGQSAICGREWKRGEAIR